MPFPRPPRHPEFRLAVVYCLAALVVVGAADLLVAPRLAGAPHFLVFLFVKDLICILATAVLVYFLARCFTRRLSHGETRYRALVENQTEAICCWLPDTTLTYVNQAYAAYFGTTVEALLDRPWLELIPVAERNGVDRQIAELLASGKPRTFMHRVVRPGGPVAWMEWTDIPVLDAAGTLLHIQSIGRDITDRLDQQREVEQANRSLAESNRRLAAAMDELKQTQHHALQQERLRALGQMASGIAHDFNNALSIIQGFTDLMIMRGGTVAPDKQAEYLQHIRTAALDAAVVISRMREFYRERGQCKEIATICLDRLIDQTIDLTRPRWESQAQAKGIDIRILTDYRSTQTFAGCEPELREAFTNLIINAVDAMPDGGTLAFRTFDRDRCIVVEVADTGQGMTEEVRQQCLQAFYTTKGAYGTGLGLPSVLSAVERHSGQLELRSSPGAGTTVTLTLPVASDDPGPVAGAGDSGTHPAAGDPILVVDDDSMVLDMLVELLSELGYSVTPADSAQAALELYPTQTFALVVTDLAMPGMNGRDFIAAIRGHNPGQRILMITGFSGHLHEPKQESGADLVLGKPIEVTELKRAVRQLLAP